MFCSPWQKGGREELAPGRRYQPGDTPESGPAGEAVTGQAQRLTAMRDGEALAAGPTFDYVAAEEPLVPGGEQVRRNEQAWPRRADRSLSPRRGRGLVGEGRMAGGTATLTASAAPTAAAEADTT
ncbi:hypothetical protein [Streptomyces sp. MH60]|uniref:hypothetical protein n=1 Tax=Streptomyces sp. MH60 TaxID=1940758 RepID=UPI000D3FC2FA|nr:hypothetical protein [Streptomyces sp. MH60]PPS89765.1 hypothetical protein BZZ08_01550 [Streptomyces sp. MH60]